MHYTFVNGCAADVVRRTFPGLKLLGVALDYEIVRDHLSRPDAEDGCLVWIAMYASGSCLGWVVVRQVCGCARNRCVRARAHTHTHTQHTHTHTKLNTVVQNAAKLFERQLVQKKDCQKSTASIVRTPCCVLLNVVSESTSSHHLSPNPHPVCGVDWSFVTMSCRSESVLGLRV